MDARAKIASTAGKAVLDAFRKDRDHRYRLNQPWSLPRLVEPVPDYHGRYVTIEDSVITVQPSDICDGATLAPDKVGRWLLIEAALAHDALYAELDQIAKEWAKTITELDAAIRNIERGRPAMVDGVSYGPADKDELIEWRDRISDVRKWADDVLRHRHPARPALARPPLLAQHQGWGRHCACCGAAAGLAGARCGGGGLRWMQHSNRSHLAGRPPTNRITRGSTDDRRNTCQS